MRRTVIRWVAIVWISGITAGSLMPTDLKIAIGSTTSEPVRSPRAEFEHRLFHYVSFGVAALLLLLLASNHRQELIAAFAVAALGVTIELIQHFIMLYPLFEWDDVRDDMIAIVVALIAIQFKGFRARLLAEG